MKTSFVFTRVSMMFIVVFLFHNCEKEKIEDPAPDLLNIVSPLAGSWKAVSFEDYETSTIIVKTIENTWQCCDGDNTVSFIFSGSNGGIMEGLNVTNTFHGNFTIDQEGNIFVDNLIWTERGEPEWGNLFHSIAASESYEIKDNQLVIFYNQKNKSITLQRL